MSSPKQISGVVGVAADTKQGWETHNPILPCNVLGLEQESKFFKLGDGIHPWLDLPYRLMETLTSAQKLLLTEANLPGGVCVLDETGRVPVSHLPEVAHPISSGSWTPTLAGLTVPGSHTYAIQTGHWTKIGTLVYAGFDMAITAIDPAMAGLIVITGLPFPNSPATQGNLTISNYGYISASAEYTQLGGFLNQGNNYAILCWSGNGAAPKTLDPTNFMGMATLNGILVYNTAQ